MKINIKLFLFILLFSVIGNLSSIIKPVNVYASDTCADSDGGIDYYTKGTIQYKEYDINGSIITTSDHGDSCVDAIIGGNYKKNVLREYYCDANNKVQYEHFECLYGCQSDACNKVAPVKVISPNGGESWQVEKPYSIKWDSINNATGQATIDLYKAGAKIKTLLGTELNIDLSSVASSSPDYVSTWKIVWTPDSSLTAGSDYKIRIADSTSKIYDESDNYFSIVNPNITCADSDGGQNYNVKGYVNLTGYGWDYCKDNSTLYENDCGTDINGRILNGGRTVAHTCLNGCVDGACVSASTDWDISVKFDSANKGPFYPFSSTAGLVGITYYKNLNETDSLYEEYIGREACESDYWGDIYEKEKARRAKGWYAERKKITEDKYKLLIRGVAPADCSYDVIGYAKGELNLNSEWKITEVVKCNVQTSNKSQTTYCETGDRYVKFAAGSNCGGCCACADSGGLDIEVIVEKKNVDISLSLQERINKVFEFFKNKADAGVKITWDYIHSNIESVMYSYGISDIANPKPNTDVINVGNRIELPLRKIYPEESNCILPDGTLVKLPNDPKIYVIRDCNKYWIQSIEEFNSSGYKWSDVNELPLSTVNSIPDTSTTPPLATNISDGAIIQVSGSPDVYIVKYAGKKAFKRLILSPSVFKSYEHLKWENIKKVDQSTLDSFTTSNLVRSAKTGKVYELNPSEDKGMKKRFKDLATFQRRGYDSEAVYEINDTDENSYDEGEELE